MTLPTRQAAPVAQPTGPGVLEDAFASFQDELLGTLFYLTGNLEDARDALQETFIKCWRNQHKLVEVRNLKAWVFRIALNTGRDIRQTAWRRRRRPLPEDETSLASAHQGPVLQAERSEQESQLRAAIGELRPEEQEVFLLRQNGDMTYEEIAVALEVPTGTVKTRMRLAIAKLRTAVGNTPNQVETKATSQQ